MKRKILRGLFITQYKERKEGETRWNGVPQQRDGRATPTALPFQNTKEAFVTRDFGLDRKHLILVSRLEN